MPASIAGVALPRFDPFADHEFEGRHRLLGRLVRAALSARLSIGDETVYADVAQLGAFAGLIGGARMRNVAAAAVQTLESSPTTLATWRFAWNWWYQRAACGALAYQAARLDSGWAERHIAAPDSLPGDGCVLISVHHFNQRLAFARLSSCVTELGAVSMFEPLAESDPQISKTDFAASAQARLRSRSRFSHEVFGPRLYQPGTAARQGLELLRHGGSLIVLSDFLGREPARLLGKRWLLPPGPMWFAEQSGRPIVPFVLSPTRDHDRPWQLWCGEPIAPTLVALSAALEECVRGWPTAWSGWPAW